MHRISLCRNEFFKRVYERKRRFVDTLEIYEHTLTYFLDTFI
jgi:hypothetical protein